MKKIYPGVWKENDKFYTRNLKPGNRVYGENLIEREGVEYREWQPERSKLSAALKKGVENFPLDEGKKVLYLGAGQGTTSSHLSDIVKKEGIIYLVEFSERAVRDLLQVCEARENMVPILADARKPGEYERVEEVDIIFEDVAQPDQAEILIRNAKKFLKSGGYIMLAVKAKAVDVAKDPEEIYQDVRNKLEDNFEILESTKLDPWEKDHCFIVARKS